MIAQDGAALSVSFYWCQRVQPAFLMPPLVCSVSHREPIRRPRLTIRRRQEFLPDEKSKGGCKSANGRDMCSGTSAAHRRTRHPPWLIHILCQILIEQIDGFWFSIKEIWEFKDGAVKDIDTCGWGIIDGDCRIFLFVSQGKWYDCWDVRCWINSSSSCWKVPPPPPLGDVSLGVDKEIDLVDLAILN